jgi:2-polyprenyl-3-methyl-5-hydroxy-6-metoxy-1,4-benzoquinol methylase
MNMGPALHEHVADGYELCDGIYRVPLAVEHREAEYDSRGFDLLQHMQKRHFWYRGRHRFLLHALERQLRASPPPPGGWRVLDLGGGCGGWLAHLMGRMRFPVAELALADSSERALTLANECLPREVRRYQVDLLDLHWQERWDVVFLLDVLEHIPQDQQALRQIYKTLAPGGFLLVTTPALRYFWTRNDDLVGHVRRYSRSALRRLAEQCGYEVCTTRYFMFYLSFPLLASRWLSRLRREPAVKEDPWRAVERTHRVPHPILNSLLGAIFCCETPLGHYLPFPWGTSVLAVLRRPI